jgi:hypothetical protein
VGGVGGAGRFSTLLDINPCIHKTSQGDIICAMQVLLLCWLQASAHGCTGTLLTRSESVCAYDRVDLLWSFQATVRLSCLLVVLMLLSSNVIRHGARRAHRGLTCSQQTQWLRNIACHCVAHAKADAKDYTISGSLKTAWRTRAIVLRHAMRCAATLITFALPPSYGPGPLIQGNSLGLAMATH